MIGQFQSRDSAPANKIRLESLHYRSLFDDERLGSRSSLHSLLQSWITRNLRSSRPTRRGSLALTSRRVFRDWSCHETVPFHPSQVRQRGSQVKPVVRRSPPQPTQAASEDIGPSAGPL